MICEHIVLEHVAPDTESLSAVREESEESRVSFQRIIMVVQVTVDLSESKIINTCIYIYARDIRK